MQRGDGSVTILDADLRIDSQRVRLGGATGDAEDAADLVIRFSLAEPEEHVGLAPRQIPRRVIAQPIVELIFVFQPIFVRGRICVQTSLGIGDMWQNQIQHRAIALGKIRAVAVQADENKCSGRFAVGEHSRQFTVHAERTVENVVKLGAMKGAPRDHVGEFPGLRGMRK